MIFILTAVTIGAPFIVSVVCWFMVRAVMRARAPQIPGGLNGRYARMLLRAVSLYNAQDIPIKDFARCVRQAETELADTDRMEKGNACATKN